MDRSIIIAGTIVLLLFIFKSIVGISLVGIYNWIPLVVCLFLILSPLFFWAVIRMEKHMREEEEFPPIYQRNYKPTDSSWSVDSLSFKISIRFFIGILMPFVFSQLIAETIVGAYTELWGHNVSPYTSYIVKKEYQRSSGKHSTSYYYVYVVSNEYGEERFDSYRLYSQGDIGDGIRIWRKISSLGYTIQPNEMILIKK